MAERRDSVVKTTDLRGALRHNEPMARYTSWRAGGPARRFYRPADLDDLARFLSRLPPDEPVYWIGLGSNLLVRDGGLEATVICTSGALDTLAAVAPTTVLAEAGVAAPKVARFCARRDLGGAEFLTGIPGTVGGALAMNAGAFGGETWAIVETVQTIDRAGVLRTRDPSEYRIGYRFVEGPREEWFVAARFNLSREAPGAVEARLKRLLARRAETQPIGTANAGSVFRNPPGDHAARLIEAAGLKGACEGAACVSQRHANFIVNRGGATAAQIETLIRRIQELVADRCGVRLEPEVRIVGEPAP